ncbi:MAG: tetratricopeptide repeat protein [Bacteroidetes bacterium]|jgi:tetratricopeptide (TPR) repeat protein|nr:tetratricopeptide repeat protein [Bacteroidota bacterium]
MLWIYTLLALCSVYVADRPRLTYYLEQASRLKEAQRFEAAIVYLDSALAMSPANAAAHTLRASCYQGLGQEAMALADYDQAIRLDPKNDYAYLLRAYLLAHYDQYEQLQPTLFQNDRIYDEAYLARLQKDYRLDFLPGHTSLYDYAAAVRSLDTALSLKRDCVPCLHLRARLQKARGNTADALKDLDQAIALQPTADELYVERALVYQVMGEYVQAYYDLTTATEQAPTNAQAYQNRAVLLQEYLNNPESACRDFRTAHRLGARALPAYASTCLE